MCDCHGVDVQESNLRVDVKASLLRGGDLGEPAILKGKGADKFSDSGRSGNSQRPENASEGKGLSDTEVSILRTWIDQGVEWPGQADSTKLTTDHWSFQEIVRPAEPQLKSPWIQNAIDKYILAALQEKGIRPPNPRPHWNYFGDYDLLIMGYLRQPNR